MAESKEMSSIVTNGFANCDDSHYENYNGHFQRPSEDSGRSRGDKIPLHTDNLTYASKNPPSLPGLKSEGKALPHETEGTSRDTVADQMPITPIKTQSKPTEEPLTPTANLKMLVSVASPAIRDLENKKKELFRADDSASQPDTPVNSSPDEEAKPAVISRKDKSLGLLCQRFLARYPEDPKGNDIEVCLDEVAKDLKVERRRIYDIVNVLESVEVISRLAKNKYIWHGKTRMRQTLAKLKILAKEQNLAMKKGAGKENPPVLDQNNNNQEMTNKEGLVNKDELEARRDTADVFRRTRDKSLGVLSQKFLMLFLVSETKTVTLEDAANTLIEEEEDGTAKYKTKVRRLYDIANILSSLKLIEKVHIVIHIGLGKKPGFKWVGIDVDNLDLPGESLGNSKVSANKHSLLPEQDSCDGKFLRKRSGQKLFRDDCYPRKTKLSRSQSARTLTRRYSSRSCNSDDGFSLNELLASPDASSGRDISDYSPTEVKFRAELKELSQKYPERINQLFHGCHGQTDSGRRISRRSLFLEERNAAKSMSSIGTSPLKFAELSPECEDLENADKSPRGSVSPTAQFKTYLTTQQMDTSQPMTVSREGVSPPLDHSLHNGLGPNASIAIQTNLVQDISPLKPLSMLIPSPQSLAHTQAVHPVAIPKVASVGSLGDKATIQPNCIPFTIPVITSAHNPQSMAYVTSHVPILPNGNLVSSLGASTPITQNYIPIQPKVTSPIYAMPAGIHPLFYNFTPTVNTSSASCPPSLNPSPGPQGDSGYLSGVPSAEKSNQQTPMTTDVKGHLLQVQAPGETPVNSYTQYLMESVSRKLAMPEHGNVAV